MNHIIKQFYKFDRNIHILTIISFLARIILLSILPFIPFLSQNNNEYITNITLKYLSLLNNILPFLVINFFIMITHQQLTTNLPLYLKSYTINGANIYFIILLINTLITMIVIKNFEKQNIFLLLLMPIGMFLFQYINLFPILIIATIIYSIGEFFFFPYITYNAEKNMPDKLKSTSFALLNIARFGLGIGGLLGEYVVKKFGYNILFILSATIQFIIILYTINLIKKKDC